MLEYLALLLLCEICLPRICIFWPYFLAAYRAHQMNDISVGKNNDLMRARWRRRREPDRNSVAADPHSTSVRLDTPLARLGTRCALSHRKSKNNIVPALNDVSGR